MLNLHWQGRRHDLRRLVIRNGEESSFDREIAAIAGEYRLLVADDTASPQPGDFWIGTHPRAGWSGTDPDRVAWASIVETALALRVLRAAAHRRDITLPAYDAWSAPVVVQAA